MYEHQLSFIKHFVGYAKKFKCKTCERHFDHIGHLHVHQRTCFNKTKYVLPVGFLKSSETIFEKLEAFLYKEERLIKSTEQRCMLDLGADRYVVARKYINTLYIHLRQYSRGNGKLFPTKQGIALNLKRWLKLESWQDDIDKVISNQRDKKFHLGGVVDVTISSKYPNVDVRQFWMPQERSIPIRKGLAMKYGQWEKLFHVHH
ncbi:hypothetical protein KUTeg_006563 [Tegillarca granosa]|uniref:C2H2-type domain-containing protein n=1 Tax=Tegillarca granosa TaxID=220873 RepID=A0ABQ9FH86_TEGGR|nr:hypothetical protein KUTeg_006563 [Tegillarca granosa]